MREIPKYNSENPHETSGDTYLTRDWQGENVLHVYPYTFNEERPEDEAHKGIGSIRGITEKLDFLEGSGVTAIWLGPIYDSPGRDGNYDVADYYKVNSDLGTIEDVKELISQAHQRDIRVIFDLVPNHTSDQSEWFRASSDPSHPDHDKYRDYYIWHDPVEGELPEGIVAEDRLDGLPDGYTVPNNWSSIFSLPQIDKARERYGGEIPEGANIPAVTAWVWSKERKQFYLAEFMQGQPSLNWQNAQVREEIKDVVRFWLDMGVDSFRVDVVNHMGKDPEFKNEEPAPVGTKLGQYNPGVTNPHDQNKQERLVSHWPQLGIYVKELISVLDEEPYKHRNIRFVFEDWMATLSDDKRLDEVDPLKATVFNFETLLNTNRERWTARNFRGLMGKYYRQMDELLGSVPNQVTGNHDTDTIRTRLGSEATARAAKLMLATTRGSYYLWQGDMLGRPNVKMPKERMKDGDIGQRDGERVPMQWDGSLNSGFSRADPEDLWLPTVDPKFYENDNIQLQSQDPNSPYRFIRDVLLRRKEDPALREGGVRMLNTDNADVLAFAREDPTDPRRQVVSVTNFTQNTTSVSILDAHHSVGRVTITSTAGSQRKGESVDLNSRLVLGPDESLVVDSV